MAEISDTELGATQREQISALVQITLKQESKLIPTITDYSSQVGKGDKSVSIPKRDQLAAADKSENTALTKQEMTFSVDTILLDKKKAILASIEMIPDLQAMVNARAEVILEMAKELALQVDKDIIVQLKLASTAAPDHIVTFDSGTVVTQADILRARELLGIQNVPLDRGDVFVGFHPTQEKDLLGISDFVRADTYGSPEGLVNGQIGRIYGMSVILSTEFGAAEMLTWHRTAVGYASQAATQFKRDDDLENIAEKLLMWNVYGTKRLDTGKRQVLTNATGS